MEDFLSALNSRVLVADGALGTRLQALTGNAQSCIDGYNLDDSYKEIVGLVHRSYIEAGADLILTNTYGANAIKLERYARRSHVLAINEEGALLARRAVGDSEVYVAGSIGPLEWTGSSDGCREDRFTEVFCEQIEGLVRGGVDLLLFETFQSLIESRAALLAAQQYDLPVMFSFGGVTNGRTSLGVEAEELVLQAASLGADVVGVNCRGTFDIAEALERISRITPLPLLAMPNAGSPEIDRGRVAYRAEPQMFRDFALRLVELGANLVGGCCGTGPEHIRQMKDAVEGRPVPPPRDVSGVRVSIPRPTAPRSVPDETEVEKVFKTVPFVISVEMRTPRGTPLSEFIEAGRVLARKGVHLFDVPDNAGAKVALDPMVATMRLQQETRIPTVMHLSASHRNLIATQSYLLGCWECGVSSVLAVTGDHPNVGDHDKYASRVNDIKSSVNLLKLMASLDRGRLFNGSPCTPTGFFSGAGFNPMRNLTPQLKWLEKKIDAGAKFLYTQPLYDPRDAERMMKALEPFDIPVLVGLLPLSSRRNAEFFAAGKIPGVMIPDRILERYRRIESDEEALNLSLEMAAQMLLDLQGLVQGCYLIPPFVKNKFACTAEILERAGVKKARMSA